jgi:hypothetical protein
MRMVAGWPGTETAASANATAVNVRKVRMMNSPGGVSSTSLARLALRITQRWALFVPAIANAISDLRLR